MHIHVLVRVVYFAQNADRKTMKDNVWTTEWLQQSTQACDARWAEVMTDLVSIAVNYQFASDRQRLLAAASLKGKYVSVEEICMCAVQVQHITKHIKRIRKVQNQQTRSCIYTLFFGQRNPHNLKMSRKRRSLELTIR